MAEKTAAERYAELKKKRTFKKFQYRGVDLDNLIDLPYSELVEMFNSRQRRRCSKGGLNMSWLYCYQRILSKTV